MNWRSNQRVLESIYRDPPEVNAFKIGYAQGWGDIQGESTAAKCYPTPYWAGHRAGSADRHEHEEQKHACNS